MQDLASNITNILYATTVHSEQLVAALCHETGIAHSMVEEAIKQVGSSVQLLRSHVE